MPEAGEAVHRSVPEVNEAASWQRCLWSGCPVLLYLGLLLSVLTLGRSRLGAGGEVNSGPSGSHLLYVGCGWLTLWLWQHQLGSMKPLGFPVLDSLEMGIQVGAPPCRGPVLRGASPLLLEHGKISLRWVRRVPDRSCS